MEISEKRCWKGFKRVPGKQPYSKGSCMRESYKLIGKVLLESKLLEANIFKQARRHLANIEAKKPTHSTSKEGAIGITQSGAVRPGPRTQWGSGTYWAAGSPARNYGEYGFTKHGESNIKPIMRQNTATGKIEPYIGGRIQMDPTPEGTPIKRKDTLFGTKPEDVQLRRQAREKGLRVVDRDAQIAAEKAFQTKSAIDYEELMKTHRRNRKQARKLRRQASKSSLESQNTAESYKLIGKVIAEEGLHAWFKNSRSTSGKPGWVQVVSGKPCARQPGQKSTPKCVSSAKRASMTPQERKSAQARKRRMDPNQPSKSGAAKPTYVPTDKPKRK